MSLFFVGVAIILFVLIFFDLGLKLVTNVKSKLSKWVDSHFDLDFDLSINTDNKNKDKDQNNCIKEDDVPKYLENAENKQQMLREVEQVIDKSKTLISIVRKRNKKYRYKFLCDLYATKGELIKLAYGLEWFDHKLENDYVEYQEKLTELITEIENYEIKDHVCPTK